MFMSMNRNHAFNEGLRHQNNLSGYLRLPLNNEGIKVPDTFKSQLQSVFMHIPKRDLIALDNPELIKLIDMVRDNNDEFSKHIDLTEHIVSKLLNEINH